MKKMYKKKDSRFVSMANTSLESFENTFKGTARATGQYSQSDVPLRKVSFQANSRFSLVTSEPKKLAVVKTQVKKVATKVSLVHGEDDRRAILRTEYPYNTICLLLINTDLQTAPLRGTGFFVSKRCILTAGHCVFTGGDWVRSVTVIPGAIGDIEPFGRATGTVFRSVEGWTKDHNSNFDYGAVILDNNDLYNKINAHLGFMPSSQESSVEIAGYPVDKNKLPHTASGAVHSRSKFKLFYDIDTEGGNSGSPILLQESPNFYSVGIHTDGDNPDNHGIRLRQEMIDRLNEWTKL